ncbi:Isobutyryl-CoA mutase / P-loop GTPase [Frankia sp. AiPs1]|uniref:methylmalonyl-CoA mutase family protein n=1 Tax=Frankia sp. AiPa1 TaxID=573492 RepID=UPI00202AD1CF|nr:methylmalonyl-CoA mutase family protein [Frankia sp. AiPa1]MCL9759037.1 methylmalonyl-CoA mutase family protein [Frankia sp. AiPa1]
MPSLDQHVAPVTVPSAAGQSVTNPSAHVGPRAVGALQIGTDGLHVPVHPVRIVTAAALFDGHDAAINIMRRLLQAQGAEVIHLGHDRSVDEIVTAAIQEDVQGVAISSYQGGHVEYFSYLVQRLRERGAGHVRVFGGGGGVIVPAEIELLQSRGVTKIFSPQDGQAMGLAAMINTIIRLCDMDLAADGPRIEEIVEGQQGALARAITVLSGERSDNGHATELAAALRAQALRCPPMPVLGITGTGGSGKSSLTDELLRRFQQDQGGRLRIAVLAVDPSRRRGGGALLGDRIRMNALAATTTAATPAPAPLAADVTGANPDAGAGVVPAGPVFFRSLATRGAGSEIPASVRESIVACRAAGYDLVILETPGIGQGDAAVAEHSDVALYVMTPEYGAASQLEKIEMLDVADVVAVNKFERRGAEDARRDVARQLLRNREAFDRTWADMPVFGTSAARFHDDGVTALYQHLLGLLRERGLRAAGPGALAPVDIHASSGLRTLIPPARARYLAEIADTVRAYHRETDRQAQLARHCQHLATAEVAIDAEIATSLGGPRGTGAVPASEPGPSAAAGTVSAAAVGAPASGGGGDTGFIEAGLVRRLRERAEADLEPWARELLAQWPRTVAERRADELTYQVRGRDVHTPLWRTTLAGSRVPRVAVPDIDDDASLLRFLRRENLPGAFPYTAGCYPFRRVGEAPARMFAGEGDPARTNRRFHLLSAGSPATRLSTAFDSVTLYGRDPAAPPDIYGKIGTSGVSVATLDDMSALFEGFDLCDPATSVSMTINGPAPAILAMFLTTAIDQQRDAFTAANGRAPDDAEGEEIAARALSTVRGTVQADILKEDQGQNTCIFSTDFALRAMADVQEWFIAHNVRNFYSVSISGYHIAEAGANPITQLAFTLANGFTYVEAYLARGMRIDDFAPNLSFFFSNGMDAEYTVIGRVARRLWAVAMRDRYGAGARSQMLKYHVQTSGRSLHAQEMDFNDIRTTLQALCALYDNCNSLHTNAYDEAVTTPTESSVRRALAIQMIIGEEWGLSANENPLQGSFVVDELTDLVEEAVLAEFERISDRGGVLGAMETGYQRGRIQDESMLYERRKHDGSLPIIGVNTFRAQSPPAGADSDDTGQAGGRPLELARATETEKRSQLDRLGAFQRQHAAESGPALAQLRTAAAGDGNVFAALMNAVRVCSLGQITDAFFDAGGQYRRNV